MRTDEEMYNLILDYAKNDNRVLAVYMNGSRTNKNVPKDKYQDFDIVYVVKETKSFIDDPHWIDYFGDILVMELPDVIDKIRGYEVDYSVKYTYLMQYTDGTRIDLSIITKEHAIKELCEDKLARKLLDKDNILPQIEEATDIDYWVRKPTKEEFKACVIEFFWVCPYVAKGLWRKEHLFAIEHMNKYIRKELSLLLSWYVGYKYDYKVSSGKLNKYFNVLLEKEYYNRLLSTYAMSNDDDIWRSLFIIIDLFDEIATILSKNLGYDYSSVTTSKVINYLNDIKQDKI